MNLENREKKYQLLKDIPIDEIYVINMKKDVKRKEDMVKTFEKYQIQNLCVKKSYTFYEAHDWTNKESPKGFRGPRNGGAYGCLMSHLGCIDNAIADNHEIVMICEDDLMFHRDFQNIWNNTYIPKCWELLYLSSTQLKWDNVVQTKPYNSFYVAKKSLGGTCYILKKHMYNVVKNLFSIHRKPIDELLIIAQEKHLGFVLYPNLCINYMNVSNIRKNNTWKIETTGKRLRWDIEKYDQSIILDT